MKDDEGRNLYIGLFDARGGKGYDIVGRITLRDRATGKEYR